MLTLGFDFCLPGQSLPKIGNKQLLTLTIRPILRALLELPSFLA